jgi:hypothetical protein
MDDVAAMMSTLQEEFDAACTALKEVLGGGDK